MTRCLLPAMFVAWIAFPARGDDPPVEPLAAVLRRIDDHSRALDRRGPPFDAPPPRAAGRSAVRLASSENFLLVLSGHLSPERVLDRAEALRDNAARDWLGDELPVGAPRAVLHVELSDANTGRTTPAKGEGDLVAIWVAAPDEATLHATLEHELTHVVLRERFPEGIPAWANEGAASLADDPRRQQLRRDLVADWRRTGNWPSLAALFARDPLPSHDRAAYAAAASVTRFLVDRRGKREFVRFVEAGRRDGWDAALRTSYGLAGVGALEAAWRERAGQSEAAASTRAIWLHTSPE